ncbi:hypothetical protein B0F90DRAFT_1722169 [Multifurca ochricompacta]|uniref:Uncharacterized protein n=1 Tax=Multifurca ochricompacta TaxID=376703 RepID=A0AAD4M5W9_9AGAM|nr:hypothetical protein B0F90DRAFT_1722169 [Multifurca ochricompacta]
MITSRKVYDTWWLEFEKNPRCAIGFNAAHATQSENGSLFCNLQTHVTTVQSLSVLVADGRKPFFFFFSSDAYGEIACVCVVRRYLYTFILCIGVRTVMVRYFPRATTFFIIIVNALYLTRGSGRTSKPILPPDVGKKN